MIRLWFGAPGRVLTGESEAVLRRVYAVMRAYHLTFEAALDLPLVEVRLMLGETEPTSGPAVGTVGAEIAASISEGQQRMDEELARMGAR